MRPSKTSTARLAQPRLVAAAGTFAAWAGCVNSSADASVPVVGRIFRGTKSVAANWMTNIRGNSGMPMSSTGETPTIRIWEPIACSPDGALLKAAYAAGKYDTPKILDRGTNGYT